MTAQQRVCLQTLGCRLNEAETEVWAQQFQQRGFHIVGADERADLIIINTCAVTEEAVRKSRKLLRRSQRANPQARLAISGCLAALDPATLAQEQAIDVLVTNADKDRLVEIVCDVLALPTMPQSAALSPIDALFARNRQRAFVKIQDGCRYQCAFCITTQARGAERSRPRAEIIQAIEHLASSGIHEVVLTGVQLGGYRDQDGCDLTGLIRAILTETRLPRLRIGSLEPWDLDQTFWSLFADSRLMPHLHLPLQSGSDRILKRMARRCKRAEFERLVETGRAHAPSLNLTTDIIVGFPGETEDDWMQTLELVEQVGFGDIHIFAYSLRAGTPAAEMPDQIDEAIKRERCQTLRRVATRLRLETLQRQLGAEVEALCERIEAGVGFGYTPNYLPVAFDVRPFQCTPGRCLTLELDRVDTESGRLHGGMVPSD